MHTWAHHRHVHIEVHALPHIHSAELSDLIGSSILPLHPGASVYLKSPQVTPQLSRILLPALSPRPCSFSTHNTRSPATAPSAATPPLSSKSTLWELSPNPSLVSALSLGPQGLMHPLHTRQAESTLHSKFACELGGGSVGSHMSLRTRSQAPT